MDKIYEASAIKLEPQPIDPKTTNIMALAAFAASNAMIQKQWDDAGGEAGELTAGIKKDVVITPELARRPPPPRVAIHGWHRLNGEAIQPLSLVHEESYVDYSHGVRLVAREMMINGETTDTAAVLRDPFYSRLLSDEGPLTSTSFYKGW